MYLIFNREGVSYAVSLDKVKKVVNFCSIIKVPLMRKGFAGFIKFGKEYVPLRALSCKGRETKAGNNPEMLAVIGKTAKGMVGLIADSIEKVDDLDGKKIKSLDISGDLEKNRVAFEGKDIYLVDLEEITGSV